MFTRGGHGVAPASTEERDMSTSFTKLGQAEPNDAVHAIKDETLGNWEGPESFCGKTMKITLARSKNRHEARCTDCRNALGLTTLARPQRGLTMKQRFGGR
jgi:hypothetical protein